METEDLKILLAIEPIWTISFNGLEFQTLQTTDISVESSRIRIGKWLRRIDKIEWLRPNVVRIRGHQRARSKPDVLTLYPGERLPSGVDLRRRRRAFQSLLGKTLGEHFKSGTVQKHSIGGPYPRFIIGNRAVIAVDPDDSSTIVNAVIRAALLWAPLVHRRITVVVPKHRAATIASRLLAMPRLRGMFDWLLWDGNRLEALSQAEPESYTAVHEFNIPDLAGNVERVVSNVSLPVQPVLNIAGRAVSIRFKGIEIAQVREASTTYPLGEPLDRVVRELDS